LKFYIVLIAVVNSTVHSLVISVRVIDLV